MKTIYQILLSVLLFLISQITYSQKWKSVDDPSLAEGDRIGMTDYEVHVSTRKGAGKWQKVKVHGALVSQIEKRMANARDTSGTERTLMGFAMFEHSFNRPVYVRVRRQGTPFGSVEIRPSSYKIPYKRIDSRTIEFRIDSPDQRLSVEFDGDRNHNLFVIPDRPMSSSRQKSEGHFRYYGPGEHHAGMIRLNSGDTLYIDSGAVVYGQIEAYKSHDITVMGNGILCASRAVHDFAKRRSMVYMYRCRNVHMEGVMFRGSPSWTLHFRQCDSVMIDNVKEICWARNSDGIDLLNCRHVTVRNSFLRNYDDLSFASAKMM